MKVPQQRALEVLRDTVIEGLEGGQKGSKFPTVKTRNKRVFCWWNLRFKRGKTCFLPAMSNAKATT
jgi:hypothetical protein